MSLCVANLLIKYVAISGCKQLPQVQAALINKKLKIDNREVKSNKLGEIPKIDPQTIPKSTRLPNKKTRANVIPEGTQTAATLFGIVAKSRLSFTPIT